MVFLLEEIVVEGAVIIATLAAASILILRSRRLRPRAPRAARADIDVAPRLSRRACGALGAAAARAAHRG